MASTQGKLCIWSKVSEEATSWAIGNIYAGAKAVGATPPAIRVYHAAATLYNDATPNVAVGSWPTGAAYATKMPFGLDAGVDATKSYKTDLSKDDAPLQVVAEPAQTFADWANTKDWLAEVVPKCSALMVGDVKNIKLLNCPDGETASNMEHKLPRQGPCLTEPVLNNHLRSLTCFPQLIPSTSDDFKQRFLQSALDLFKELKGGAVVEILPRFAEATKKAITDGHSATYPLVNYAAATTWALPGDPGGAATMATSNSHPVTEGVGPVVVTKGNWLVSAATAPAPWRPSSDVFSTWGDSSAGVLAREYNPVPRAPRTTLRTVAINALPWEFLAPATSGYVENDGSNPALGRLFWNAVNWVKNGNTFINGVNPIVDDTSAGYLW